MHRRLLGSAASALRSPSHRFVPTLGSAAGALLVAVVVSTGLSPTAQAAADADAKAQAAAGPGSPTVTPASGGNGVPVIFGHTSFDLASVGYAQSEYFVEGTASAFTPTAPLTTDGRWTLTTSAPAAYKTRIVVNRPTKRRTSTAPWSSSGSTSRAAPTPAPTGSTCTTS